MKRRPVDGAGAPDKVVSAADFVRSFAKWREIARTEPVKIAQHGRVTHVLSSCGDYAALEDLSRSMNAIDPAAMFELAEWLDSAIVAIDQDANVVFSNRVADAITGVHLPRSAGQNILDICPAISGTVAEVHLRRTLAAREPTSIDMPSPFKEGMWLHFRSFPLRDLTVLTFNDITEDVKRYRLADTKEAIVNAISVNGALGYMRLSIRGTIERADPSICSWLGLTEERLRGVAFVDILAREVRVIGRQLIESTLTGNAPQMGDLRLMTNEGDVQLKCSCAPLVGTIGAEGVVMILIRCEQGR